MEEITSIQLVEIDPRTDIITPLSHVISGQDMADELSGQTVLMTRHDVVGWMGGDKIIYTVDNYGVNHTYLAS